MTLNLNEGTTMNMLTFDKTEIQHQNKPFIAEAVFAVETVAANQQREKQIKAKQLLDRLFPLENGTHQDVTAYVIDYNHLLAYFQDGRHSGLKYPKQFVAFNGSKENPSHLLFRDGEGSHVEMALGCQRGTGCIELREIADIQLETCTVLNHSNEHAQPSTTIRHWVSLLKGDEKGRPQARIEEKEYTARNGDEYFLGDCFSH
ncbi:hypothetical protein EEJ33_14300 [Vibrio cholerae]|nr:hypothetical protein EEJ33_14300 [Vibrio cholerae]